MQAQLGQPECWSVGCFGLNGPLRQYFSLYRAVSQREGERKDERKMSKQPPPAPTESTIGPCPTVIQVSRTPWHWKFNQHLRTTQGSQKQDQLEEIGKVICAASLQRCGI